MNIDPIGALGARHIPAMAQPATPTQTSAGTGFTAMLTDGLAAADAKVARADDLIRAFALGEPVPLHQVTIALEQARIAVELSVQIRERITESYRSFMNMQL